MRFIEKHFRGEETGRNRGNPTAPFAGAIPSRADGGPLEGVETRRACGIAHGNTPQASGGALSVEEIVQPRSNADQRVPELEKGKGLNGRPIFASNYLSETE